MATKQQTSLPTEQLDEVVKLAWSGYEQVGRGVLFLEEGDDYPLYVVEKYAPDIELLAKNQKLELLDALSKLDPEQHIILFWSREVQVLDVFRKTGKTVESYVRYRNRPRSTRRGS